MVGVIIEHCMIEVRPTSVSPGECDGNRSGGKGRSPKDTAVSRGGVLGRGRTSSGLSRKRSAVRLILEISGFGIMNSIVLCS